MSIIRDEHAATPGLVIIDKYEEAVTYLYPILQRCPRVHGNVRDTMMAVLFDQVGLFYQAAKSRQPSKLYAADANLATLRFWLRFAADRKLKIITPNQHKATLRLLAEAGAMLGAWIKSAKGNG